MQRFLKILKRTLLLILLLLLTWSAFNIELISYGISQFKGQMHIINSARPIEEVLKDNNISQLTKDRLMFIDTVKNFAIDSLGLKASKNYTTYYDQQNKPLLWVITACDPFNLKPYQWKFPFVGSVSYKGFFDYEK